MDVLLFRRQSSSKTSKSRRQIDIFLEMKPNSPILFGVLPITCPAAKRRQETNPIEAIKPIDVRFKQRPGISSVKFVVRPDCARKTSVARLTCTSDPHQFWRQSVAKNPRHESIFATKRIHPLVPTS